MLALYLMPSYLKKRFRKYSPTFEMIHPPRILPTPRPRPLKFTCSICKGTTIQGLSRTERIKNRTTFVAKHMYIT
ncbi:hypothetical protein WR25_00796 [Diploscapter pachys]|uniref:Uncharacterized protein n=1 Tax=Diploscapter pachys TaxID=2018661 RepID=A0A2A2JKN4_9BILA|nr:hypothetical protein WR25_00796 [Diploscapter pachys]